MNATSHSIDAAQLPAWLTPVILLVLLPFACGMVGGVFLRVIVRWGVSLVKIGSVVCLVAAVLGYVDLQAASGYTSQLWVAIVGLHTVFGQRLIELLTANPGSAASLTAGLCVGLIYGRRRPRSVSVEAAA